MSQSSDGECSLFWQKLSPLARQVLDVADLLYPQHITKATATTALLPSVRIDAVNAPLKLEAVDDNMLKNIDTQQPISMQLLRALVEQNSGSHNYAGIEIMHRLVEQKLLELGFRQVKLAAPTPLPDLHRCYVLSPSTRPGTRVLLLGHVDTVFEPDSGFDKCCYDGKRMYGPGVADMKGGLLCAIAAIATLVSCAPPKSVELRFLLTGDEELGGLSSRQIVEDEARACDVCLVLEPGREQPDNSLVIARAGAASARLVVSGNCCSQDNDADDVNPIDELARKCIAIQRLSHIEQGRLVNIGVLNASTVRPACQMAHTVWADIDVRFQSWSDADKVHAQLQNIAAAVLTRNPCNRQTTQSDLEWLVHCPPMPQTRARTDLFQMLANVAKSIGFDLNATSSSGGSDANTAAAVGSLVIDGLGPVGGAMHSNDEWVDCTSLFARAKLLAVFLTKLDQGLFKLASEDDVTGHM